MTDKPRFEVTMTREGNFIATGIFDGKRYQITCVGSHLAAVQAGKRWCKRIGVKR